MARYSFDGTDIAGDIAGKYGFDGDLVAIFATPTQAVVDKWHHYIPLYDRYFSPFRNRPVRFLEIGVSQGGSLSMWRKYFGEDAVLFGIDVNPKCAAFNGHSAQVRIGSQDDAEFLARVVSEMGGVDIVLDDGSHQMDHIRSSLASLFPALSMGGIYVIEDLHTAYWDTFGGGTHSDGNFFVEIRKIIDDMHHWYNGRVPNDRQRAQTVTGLHIHDSMVVIDKGQVYQPTHSKVGRV